MATIAHFGYIGIKFVLGHATEVTMRFQRVLKLKHLVLIHTLGTELNLRHCAQRLNTSHTAVSRTLHEIEELLGERLFERSTRSVKPTQIGLSLIWHAQRILGDLEHAEADFQALSRGVTQVLYIGVLTGFSPTLLARTISLFMLEYPDVELRLQDGLAADLFISLRQDRVDLILSHVDIPRDDVDIVAETIYQERVAIVAHPSHPLVSRRLLSMSDLVFQRWVLPPVGTTIRVAVERELLLNSSQSQLLPIVESTSPHFTAAILQRSEMIAAVPHRVARWMEGCCDAVQELQVQASLPVWPVCVAWRGGRTGSPAQKNFVGCLSRAAKDKNEVT